MNVNRLRRARMKSFEEDAMETQPDRWEELFSAYAPAVLQRCGMFAHPALRHYVGNIYECNQQIDQR